MSVILDKKQIVDIFFGSSKRYKEQSTQKTMAEEIITLNKQNQKYYDPINPKELSENDRFLLDVYNTGKQ